MEVDNLDTLKLKLTKCEFGFKAGPSTVVSIFINDKNLIDIVREIELPYATKEGCPQIAGAYSGLYAFNLWDEMIKIRKPNVEFPPEVLDCTCGCQGCWPLSLKIKEKNDVIVWSDFENVYRTNLTNPDHNWDYSKLGPFTFDKEQYETEMQKLRQWAIESDPGIPKDKTIKAGKGFTEQDVIDAHAFSINNEDELMSETKCGCFYCLEIFNPKEIEEWCDDEVGTALCPFCGIDSVIGESSGYPITKEFLQAMHDFWF